MVNGVYGSLVDLCKKDPDVHNTFSVIILSSIDTVDLPRNPTLIKCYLQ